jgi:putative ABC transport system permease protein
MKMNWGMSTDYEGLHPGELGISTKYGRVDYDFLGLYGIELVAGRNFSRQFASDKSEGGAYILNETAVKRIGWEKPIGKKFRLGYIKTRGTVVGVVKDFHNLELKRFIEPLVLHLYPPEKLYCMSIRIHSGNPSGILKEIETTWKKFNNGDPFNYYFVDEAYDNMYKAEIKLSTLFKYFSLLAIVLSCLGLLGLASFYIENSRREICIRKVLGATVTDVVRLLSWKFCRWIIIANFIAFPLAYWVMRDWLRTFAYRASIDWWIFVTGGSLALVIALLTVSYQSIKAANLNPVEAMKHE